MGSTGANRGNGATVANVNEPAFDREKAASDAVSAINRIQANKRHQQVDIVNPYDGHRLSASVEKITTRDYWGRSIGRQTYTLYVYDEDNRTEYDNAERIYYNYGMESLARVKDELRRITGVGNRR